MNRGTLTQLFFTTVDRHAGLPAAFRSKVGGTWVAITHREALERVQAISLGLRELGLNPGDKVAIISENRPEWTLTDYACLCARATDVPIYPTLTAKQTEYILRDSESVAVFCSTAAQVDKVLAVKAELPGLKHVVVFDSAAAQRPGGGGGGGGGAPLRHAGAVRHGHRHGRRNEVPDLRAVLHHEGGRKGHGVRTGHGLRNREAVGRIHWRAF
jgi:acyl-CoA synthetase (AMP-forming)/AMP-acid ligase II